MPLTGQGGHEETETAMRDALTCSFCKSEFDGPAAVCPQCGGPVVGGGLERAAPVAVGPAANEDALSIELDDEDDGGMEIVPVGVDDATLFAATEPDPAPARPRPPPLPKKIARA